MIYRVTGKCTERIDGTGDFYLRDGSRITGRRVVWTHLRNTIYCWATTTKKEREGGREVTKIEGRREKEERRRKKGSLPLDCNGREARFIALSRRCRCTHGDPSCAIPSYWLSGRWTLRGGHSRYTIQEGEGGRGQ